MLKKDHLKEKAKNKAIIEEQIKILKDLTNRVKKINKTIKNINFN